MTMTITTLEAERTVPDHGEELLGGLTPEAWDRLAGAEFYSTARWLAFVAMHGGGEPGAAVARVDGEPVAVVPFTELAAPPPPLYRWHDVLTGHGLPSPEPG